MSTHTPDGQGTTGAPSNEAGPPRLSQYDLDAVIAHFARIPRPILLIGPTGVGKTHAARAVHAARRRTGGFLNLDGGNLLPHLWASTLYGHEVGAFTGATQRAPGAVATARDGTLFLDELHHWSREVQAGVLRLIDERRYRSLGGARELAAQCDFIFATTVEVDELVESGTLLPDLRYRLPSIVLRLPPLSARRHAILPFADEVAQRAGREFGLVGPVRWTMDAVQALLLAPWPGNFRQLLGRVEAAVANLASPHSSQRALTSADLELPMPECGRLHLSLDDETSRSVIRWGRAHGLTQEEAGALIGMSRNTVTSVLRRGDGDMATGPCTVAG